MTVKIWLSFGISSYKRVDLSPVKWTYFAVSMDLFYRADGLYGAEYPTTAWLSFMLCFEFDLGGSSIKKWDRLFSDCFLALHSEF